VAATGLPEKKKRISSGSETERRVREKRIKGGDADSYASGEREESPI